MKTKIKWRIRQTVNLTPHSAGSKFSPRYFHQLSTSFFQLVRYCWKHLGSENLFTPASWMISYFKVDSCPTKVPLPWHRPYFQWRFSTFGLIKHGRLARNNNQGDNKQKSSAVNHPGAPWKESPVLCRSPVSAYCVLVCHSRGPDLAAIGP